MIVLAIHSGWQLGGSTLNLGFIVKTLVSRSHTVFVLNREPADEGSRYLERCGARLLYFPRFSLRMNTTTILESAQCGFVEELRTTVKDCVKLVTGLFLAFKYIRRVKPDILFVTDSALPQFVQAAKWSHIPVVCELQAELIRGRFGLRRRIYTYLLRRADWVFGITRFHVEPFQTFPNRDGKVTVIPNTVDCDADGGRPEFDIHTAYGIPRGKKVVSYFGGASQVKGCRFLLSVVKQLVADRDDVVFVLAGPFHVDFKSEWGLGSIKTDRPETEYLFDFVNDNALSGNIRIAGEVTNAVAIMKQSDVVVSSNSFPHFSRTIIEAFHSTVPVLASKDKFSREVIEDEENGMLAEFGRPGEWVEKLTHLLDNPTRAREIAEQGRRVYEATFHPDMVSAQVLRGFETLYAEHCR
jgi:glycosyltransferase involved in cell wall biosynthesis